MRKKDNRVEKEIGDPHAKTCSSALISIKMVSFLKTSAKLHVKLDRSEVAQLDAQLDAQQRVNLMAREGISLLMACAISSILKDLIKTKTASYLRKNAASRAMRYPKVLANEEIKCVSICSTNLIRMATAGSLKKNVSRLTKRCDAIKA